MKTIVTEVYSFNELSEDAKQIAINKYRDNGIFTDFIFDDAYNTVKKFNDIFNVKEGRDSWLNFNTNYIDSNILELKGARLQKYLWNNFKNDLFKGKYYTVKLNRPVKHNRCKSTTFKNGNTHVAYYSAVTLDNSCVLTGVCYDDDMLEPIYKFLDKSEDETTFQDLIWDCFYSLKKSIDNEVDYRHSDESIIEELESNNYDFLSNGNLF